MHTSPQDNAVQLPEPRLHHTLGRIYLCGLCRILASDELSISRASNTALNRLFHHLDQNDTSQYHPLASYAHEEPFQVPICRRPPVSSRILGDISTTSNSVLTVRSLLLSQTQLAVGLIVEEGHLLTGDKSLSTGKTVSRRCTPRTTLQTVVC
ncbi:hypothetical protein PM082_018450 [Marasmius tenuissimus]|nr:hypothetical protein PM082_018450 [Marasmius tenuissimus]